MSEPRIAMKLAQSISIHAGGDFFRLGSSVTGRRRFVVPETTVETAVRPATTGRRALSG